MKHILWVAPVVIFLGLFVFSSVGPNVVYADGIVPCGNTADGRFMECTLCHLQVLAMNFINFMIVFSTMVATLLFVYAGILYVLAPASPNNVGRAHRVFSTTLMGFILILAGWLIISFIMNSLYTGASFGSWNTILCDGTTAPQSVPADGSIPGQSQQPGGDGQTGWSDAGGDGVVAAGPGYVRDDLVKRTEYPGPVLKDTALERALGRINTNCVAGTQSCTDYIIAQANANGVDPNYALALAAIESGGCRDPVNCRSNAGAIGVTQLMPATAREICGSECAGMSNDEMERYLKDPVNNIKWGVEYMAQSSSYVDAQIASRRELDPERKEDYMAAYYNGGPTAIQPSVDCPGLTKYECGINQGGYTQTETYVEKMNTYVNSVDRGTVVAAR